MRARCVLANGLWLASAAREAMAFRRNLHRVAEVQEAILLRTLRRNAIPIRTLAEYREQVPIRTWDGLPAPLDRRAEARPTLEPVLRWERTSGSSGAVKEIPYTRSLLRELNAAIAPWIVSLFAAEPRAFAGEAYWSISPGAESDEEVLGPVQRRLVRAVQAVPSSVRLASDIEEFRRETLRHLTRCRTLSLISVWHPSFLELLVGDIDTEKTWPNLRVVSCWADANAAAPAAALARRFPHAKIQPKGLLSTEGFVTIPFEGASVLAYRSHFYEFRDGADVRLAHELEAGRRYQVVLTTGGGLYRYDTEDVVEVTGYRERAPVLRFIGRAQHVSDHFGEKLNEIFVRERLQTALRDIAHSFAMLACDRDAYVLYIDSDAPLNGALGALELSLRESHHYDYARRLGQLGPLRAMHVHNGPSIYLAVKARRQTLGDIKIPALDREQGWTERFERGSGERL